MEDSPLIRHPLQHSRFRGFVFTHNDAPQSVGLPWTSDQSLAETSTWQHTTLTPDKHPCPREWFEPTISHSFPFLVRLWWQHLVIEVFIYPSSSVIFWVILGGRLAPYQTSITQPFPEATSITEHMKGNMVDRTVSIWNDYGSQKPQCHQKQVSIYL